MPKPKDLPDRGSKYEIRGPHTLDPIALLRVAQIVSPMTAGGLERVVEALSVGLHRRGHELRVLALLRQDEEHNPVVASLRTHGVPVQEIRTPDRGYREERRLVRDALATLQPQIAHTHGYRRDILHRPTAARLGLATVTTVHGPDKTGGLKGAFFEWLQRLNFRRFDAVVAVSDALRDTTRASGVPSSRLHVVPNSWPGLSAPLERSAAREALGLDPGAPAIGWVGRFVPVKGPDLFLEALALVPPPRPLGVMIGFGPDHDRLHRQARDLGLGETVRFLTEIRDAGRYFGAFDAYVLSSRSEGLPIAILEAMAAKAPIVATRVGGVSEVVSEREAVLVTPEDPSALALAIDETLSDPHAASRRADRALERLETEYSVEVFLDRYEAVYREVLGRP